MPLTSTVKLTGGTPPKYKAASVGTGTGSMHKLIVGTLFFGAALLAGIASVGAQERHDLTTICGECRVERFAECGGFLEGATFDRNGTLWVVDLLSGNIVRVDDRGRCHVEGSTGGAPNGAKFHRDGRLFIADKNRGVLAFDPRTRKVTTVVDTYRAERLRGTNDLVFDERGGLYFTEPYGSSAIDPDGRVFYLPPGDNAELTLVADNIAFPNGIVLTGNGNNILVGEYAAKRILSMPSVTSTNVFDVAQVFAYTEGGVGPDGMAFDTNGNLYAAIFQGREVRVFAPDRFAYGSIVLPEDAGAAVTNLAFNDGFLYITEGSQGVVWRVAVEPRGLPLFHQR
jgi:gluconolactonase